MSGAHNFHQRLGHAGGAAGSEPSQPRNHYLTSGAFHRVRRGSSGRGVFFIMAVDGAAVRKDTVVTVVQTARQV
jgi:hypothetical protein